ncbi:hypothetical protein D3C76_1466390 [compost metagenome]
MLCPNSFASLYPEPSEPVFSADFPPQDKISFSQENSLKSVLSVDKINFLRLWIDLILQELYTGIFLSSKAKRKISTTEEA